MGRRFVAGICVLVLLAGCTSTTPPTLPPSSSPTPTPAPTVALAPTPT